MVKIPNNKEDMVDSYANIRLELNKLCYSTHKYIVQFIGITMDPLSFVMEYAPLGSFRKILKVYREAKCSLCPVSILLSIQQVCSMDWMCVCLCCLCACLCLCAVLCCVVLCV